jgi:histidinol-phosphate aminotransferase
MAGVRLGYSIAHPALAAEVQKAVTAFPISIFQDIAARVAIENYGRFTESVARIVAERERLAASLRALPGVTVYSSGANFLLVRPPGSARKVYDHLLNTAHILVSDSGGYPELHNCLRITVGAPEINDQVVQAFSDCL